MLVIIPCGAKKLNRKVQAFQMYTGAYFRSCLRYALSISRPEDIMILSAKYGLLKLTDEIEPYNLKMGQLGCVNGAQVTKQASDLLNKSVIGLGGSLYTNIIKQVWPNAVLPLVGVGGIGKQMQWLKAHRGQRP